MKRIYLFLAIVGTVVPYVFFIAHFRAQGMGAETFARAMFANGVAGGLTADLTISSVVFWVWMAQDRAQRAWLFVILNLSIGLSCALPAYLYSRARD